MDNDRNNNRDHRLQQMITLLVRKIFSEIRRDLRQSGESESKYEKKDCSDDYTRPFKARKNGKRFM
jgi:hypothetical protein